MASSQDDLLVLLSSNSHKYASGSLVPQAFATSSLAGGGEGLGDFVAFLSSGGHNIW